MTTRSAGKTRRFLARRDASAVKLFPIPEILLHIPSTPDIRSVMPAHSDQSNIMNRLNHSAIVALLVISSAFLMGGCDNKKDLTRERALSILKQTNMRKEGLTFAGRLGKEWCLPNVKPGSDGDPYWKFMFLLEADGLIEIVNESGNGGVYWYVIATDKGAEYRNQDKQLPFILAIPEPTEVTSIGVPSQMGGNTTKHSVIINCACCGSC